MAKTKKTASLPEAEWAFHEVPVDQRAYCLQYELKRGFDEHNSIVPWLSLNSQTRQQLILIMSRDYFFRVPPLSAQQLIVEILDLDLLVEKGPCCDSRLLNAQLTTMFHVDWRENNTELKKRFDQFIRRVRLRTVPDAAAGRRPVPIIKQGRKRGVDRRLVDVSLSRAVYAGLPRPRILSMLDPLLKAFKVIDDSSDERDGLFSQKNWAATVRMAKSVFKTELLK